MSTTPNKLKRKVMFLVYMEFLKQQILIKMEYILPIIMLAILFTSVSVIDILSNLSQTNWSSLFNFVLVAIRDTEFFVQIIFGALSLSVLVLLARKIPLLHFQKQLLNS